MAGAAPRGAHPIVWLDALIIKVREHNRVMNKAVYLSGCKPQATRNCWDYVDSPK